MRLKQLFFVGVIVLLSLLAPQVQAENDNNMTVSDVLGNSQNETTETSEVLPIDSSVEFQNDQNLFLVFLKLVGALVVVIGLIFVILRIIHKRTKVSGNGRNIENIGGIGLGTNRSVQLIKVGDRVLVVGVGESIQLLKEIDNESEIQKLVEMGNEVQGIDLPITEASKWLSAKLLRKESKNEEEFSTVLTKQLDTMSISKKANHKESSE